MSLAAPDPARPPAAGRPDAAARPDSPDRRARTDTPGRTTSVPDGSYLLELDLIGRAVLVVGGGATSARHALRLVAASADVLVVAPEICEDLAELVAAARVRWLRHELSVEDLEGVWLVHAATGSAELDSGVVALCEFTRVWCIAETTSTAPARRLEVMRRRQGDGAGR
jgi:uroporphyrin-III C-methyltransferase/precorrin-2 dehydrogenase/sirohydrochlorin ferrochelatase